MNSSYIKKIKNENQDAMYSQYKVKQSNNYDKRDVIDTSRYKKYENVRKESWTILVR